MPDFEVIISGPDSSAEYDEEAFLQEEQRLREAVQRYWKTGARTENLAEVVEGALEEATE